MEEDRIQANLGPITHQDTATETTPQPKQPRKRFVGRRTADRAEKQSSSNSTIEDSNAIQGLPYLPIFRGSFDHANNIVQQSPKLGDQRAT